MPQALWAAKLARVFSPYWAYLFFAAAIGALGFALWPGQPQLPSLLGWHVVNHLFAFTVLTMLARAAWPGLGRVGLFVAMWAFGGLIELLQALPFINRSMSIYDWGVDAAGIAMGLVLVWIAGHLAGERW